MAARAAKIGVRAFEGVANALRESQQHGLAAHGRRDRRFDAGLVQRVDRAVDAGGLGRRLQPVAQRRVAGQRGIDAQAAQGAPGDGDACQPRHQARQDAVGHRTEMPRSSTPAGGLGEFSLDTVSDASYSFVQ